MTSFKWTEEDIKYLKENVGKLTYEKIAKTLGRTVSSTKTKALRMGYCTSLKWTNEENQRLTALYSSESMDKVLEAFPHKSRGAIIAHAKSLNIKAYERQLYIWRPEEVQFLHDNWLLMPDKLLAKRLGKEQRSVKDKRVSLGLLRYEKNKGMSKYDSLSKFIRGNIYEWKKASMEACNYICCFTGGKNFHIHHLYGVSNILYDLISRNEIEVYENKDDYTKEELDTILDKFIKEQSKYPLGVCIHPTIHKLFHRLYGQYYNTPEQWYQFEKDYKNGIYND